MKTRLKILFLAPPPHQKIPWENDVIEAIDPRHELVLFDLSAPAKEQFANVDVVIDFGGNMGTRTLADASRTVKLWQILGTGFDRFDLEYWRYKKIPVANCPGQFSAIPLAECALMYILMLSRRWHETQGSLRNGILYTPMGLELEGQQLGLIGFGASARELAKRARSFGMKIAAVDVRDIPLDEQRRYGLDFAGDSADMDRVIGESDYVSLHLHLNQETRGIMDEQRLSLMKPTAYLINVARGALVDEQALCRLLQAGKLAGAGLDVFEVEPPDPANPLLHMPNVVATPHTSGLTHGTSRRRAACAAENIERVASGLEPLYRIDGLSALEMLPVGSPDSSVS